MPAGHRQTPQQHMRTVVGAEGEGTDRDSAFRYLKRSLEPKVPSNSESASARAAALEARPPPNRRRTAVGAHHRVGYPRAMAESLAI